MLLLQICTHLTVLLLVLVLLQQFGLQVLQQLIDLNLMRSYIGSAFDQLGIVVYPDAVAELDGQEDGVLDLVPDIGSSDIIVEPLRVVPYHNFTLTLTLVLPLYELLLDIVVTERLHERTKFLLLVVTRRPTRVHEDRR